jgi:hypothetical protein
VTPVTLRSQPHFVPRFAFAQTPEKHIRHNVIFVPSVGTVALFIAICVHLVGQPIDWVMQR